MAEIFIAQDLFMRHKINFVRSDVKPLTCHVCRKELNGISITAKELNGKKVFLCSHHYDSEPYQIISVD